MTWHHLKQTLSYTMTAALLAVSLAAVLALSQGAKFLSVQSGSMVPVYHRGDLVIARSVAGGNYQPGDVITFINPNNAKQTVTHRIVRLVPADRMHAQRFQTKGDANQAADTPIYKQAIIGKVGYSIPHLGTVFDFARQPIGLALLIYVPALLVIGSEMRRLIAYYKQQEPYIAPGFTPDDSRASQQRPSATIKTAAKVSAVATIAAVGVIVPTVHAALLSTTTLTGNTISSIQILNHLVVSKVIFGSTSVGSGSTTNVTVVTNNPQTASSGNVNVSGGGSATSGNASNTSNISTTITIIGGSGAGSTTTPATVSIYNPTNQPIVLSGWKLQDNSTAQTLPAGTTINAKATYTFTWPTASDNLSRSSDRLILRSPASSAVDAISWGSDTSQLNPAIVTTASTASLVRTLNTDTDKASDWTTSP